MNSVACVPKRAERRSENGRLVLGALICGGKSRRMGRDKAALVLGQRTLLERGVKVLRGIAPRVVLACGPEDRYAESGLPRVLDRAPNLGPLAGVAAALEAARAGGAENTDFVAVLATDLPFADEALFEALLARADETAADVCLLASPDGLEPLYGLYRVAVLPAVLAALEAGVRRMTGFHSGFGPVVVETLPRDSWGVDGVEDAARNVNTPEEWIRLCEEDKR